ncbi:LPS translocon maturation chaperone LptM [Ancylobacter terrae]|uniref:LPS translocon maturation chaperone LptM n=1 Tax=Ancylobacter sp. sgz301288 TaxID=3342077 RepID=UPI00385C6414
MPRSVRPARRARAALPVLAGIALLLGGCGVRGPLQPPPEAQASAPESGHHAASAVPGAKTERPRDTGPVRPNQPFILDGLL